MISNWRIRSSRQQFRHRLREAVHSCAAGMLILIATAASAEPIAPQSIVRISTGEQSTGIYRNTHKISRYISDSSFEKSGDQTSDFNLTVSISSPGSMSNIKDLIDGRSEFGIVNSHLANEMVANPKKWGVDQVIDRVRLVSRLQPSLLHILVSTKPGQPTNVKDLGNKIVSIGLPAAMTEFSIANLFRHHELTVNKMQLRYFPLPLALRQIREGKIDAVILFDQTPNLHIADLLQTGDFTLLGLDKAAVSKGNLADSGTRLVSGAPYPGLADDFLTASLDNYLLVQDNVSPSVVTPLVRLLGDPNDTIDSPIPYHDAVTAQQDTTNLTDGETTPSVLTDVLSEQVIQ